MTVKVFSKLESKRQEIPMAGTFDIIEIIDMIFLLHQGSRGTAVETSTV